MCMHVNNLNIYYILFVLAFNNLKLPNIPVHTNNQYPQHPGAF